MAEPKPPLTLELDWKGDLRFEGRSGETALLVDGDGHAGPSPVQALAYALAGCMASDVALILTKGREDLRGLRARLTGWRAETEPRRFLHIDLRFVVTGAVAADKIERALALSREKYCSVWHSLRQDIDFTVAYEIER
jgi:putative redox protein